MKTRFMLMLVLISALVLSACQGGTAPVAGNTPTPNAANKTPLPAAATKAPAVVPTQAPADVPTQAPANNGGNLDLSDVAAGLDALNSYQTTFTMSFAGTENNQPKQWSWTTLEEFVREPAAKHSKVTSTGTGTGAGDMAFESWEVSGKSYVNFGQTCVASDSNTPPSANSSFTPSSVIGDIKGAQLIGAETINGIPTQHFAVDVQRFAALGTYTDGKSEVWVATPGNYVVKYFFQATGKDAFFGSGSDAQGTIRWEYEVKNANQPITVAPPEGCGQSAADIPILPDAKNNSAFGDITTYTSATDFDTAVSFYKTQMAANGWTADESAGMSAPNFATLSFKKDTRTASVTVTFDTDKKETSVVISITK
jgi:hypothetical protein